MQKKFEKLIKLQENAYAPYSKYHVAAIVMADGKEYVGVNVENAAYPLTVCAERNAIAMMVVDGKTKFDEVYLLAGNNESFSTPCGGCRQVLYEFARSKKTPIHILNCNGEVQSYTIDELLPNAWEF